MYYSQVAQCWPFSGCGFPGCFRATLAVQITSTKCCSFDRQPMILHLPSPPPSFSSAEVPFLSRKSKASPQAILWNLLANFSSSSQESLFLMWFFVCSSGYPKLLPLPLPLPPSLSSLFPASFWPFCFGLSNFVITFFACGCYGKIFWMRLIYLYVCGRSFFFQFCLCLCLCLCFELQLFALTFNDIHIQFCWCFRFRRRFRY